MSAATQPDSALPGAITIAFNGGANIFPACPAKKTPLLKGWQAKACGDIAVIQAWWSKWPAALIGLPTGARNGLWGIDIDRRHNGHENLAALVDRHGPLPATAHYLTPGGERYLFRWPKGLRIFNRNGADGIAEGIDTRGSAADGTSAGFVILPPGIRADGGRYAWSPGSDLYKAVDAPHWLLYLVIFSPRERKELAAIDVIGHEAFNGLPPNAWQAEADARLKAARPKLAANPVDSAKPDSSDNEGRKRYVVGAIKDECEKLANLPESNRQTAIGNAVLAVQALLKGLELLGVDVDALMGWAIEQLEEAHRALGPGEHTAETIESRWERCWSTATPRDLRGKGLGSDPAEEFETIEPEALGQGPLAAKASVEPNLIRWVDDASDSEIIEWIVEEVIQLRGVGFLAAPSGKGKTFLGIDLALAIARKKAFFGRDVDNPGGTFWVAGEGGSGVRQRAKAAEAHKFGAGGVPIAYMKEAPNLLDPATLARFIARLRRVDADMRKRYNMPLRLVTFDTFAACFSIDNENDVRSVAAATKVMRQIAETLGVMVIAVHHHGKDPRSGMRGSSGLRADADVVLSVPEDGKLFLDKCRDAEDGIPLGHFKLSKVQIGVSPKGKPRTSCFVEEVDAPKGKDDTPAQAKVRKAYQRVVEKLGKPVVPDAEVKAIYVALVMLERLGKGKPTMDDRAKRDAWSYALENLPPDIEVCNGDVRPKAPSNAQSDPADEFEPIDLSVSGA